MAEQYISIKEFARRAGVSTQAVYQRLDKDLNAFLEIENGKKLLNTEALKLYTVARDSTRPCTSKSNGSVVQALLTQLDNLNKQLEIKDKQIESITAALMAEQKLHAEARQQIQLLQAAAEPEPEQAEQEQGGSSDTEPDAQQPKQGGKSFRQWWREFWEA